MPTENDIKISALSQALSLDATDYIPVVQDMGGTPVTMGATVGQLAAKTAEDTTLSNLDTASKKIVPAINELKGEIDNNFDYFINEKAIGVWIDNKVIYRCVFTGFNISSTANTWIETTVNAGNISTLINGRILDSSGQSFACSLGYSNQKVAINMPIARSNLTTLILEYTKTN